MMDTDEAYGTSGVNLSGTLRDSFSLLPHPPHTSAQHEPWGLEEFDRRFGGLAGGTFNMLAAPNYDTALAAIGHFLARGLQKKQRAALITLDNPRFTFSKLAMYGFNCETAMKSERLIYLYYKPAFTQALSCSTDYKALISEILGLAGPIHRMAFLNAELLFNLQTEYLARVSASKLTAETGCGSITTLGCYISQATHSCTLLDAACNSLMPSYLLLRSGTGQHARQYTLEWRKSPFASVCGESKLELKPGVGYVKCSNTTSQIA
jgi:hypothetical protein